MKRLAIVLLLGLSVPAHSAEIMYGGNTYTGFTWGTSLLPVGTPVPCNGSSGVSWFDNTSAELNFRLRMFQNSLTASDTLNADIVLQTTIHTQQQRPGGFVVEVVEEHVKVRNGEPTHPMGHYNFGEHYFTIPPGSTIATFITCEPRGRSSGTISYKGKVYMEWDR